MQQRAWGLCQAAPASMGAPRTVDLPAWLPYTTTDLCLPAPAPPPTSDGTEYVAPAAASPERGTPLAAQKTPAPGLLELQVGQQEAGLGWAGTC